MGRAENNIKQKSKQLVCIVCYRKCGKICRQCSLCNFGRPVAVCLEGGCQKYHTNCYNLDIN